MPDDTPYYLSWSTTGNNDFVWYGEQRPLAILEWHEGWYPLEHEDDYRGIADQLLAEDLGLTEMEVV